MILFLHIHAVSLYFFSDPNALGQRGPDHALIGGVVAVVVFITLCLIIVLGRYLARHKGKRGHLHSFWIEQKDALNFSTGGFLICLRMCLQEHI